MSIDPVSVEGSAERAAERGSDMMFGNMPQAASDMPSLSVPSDVEQLIRDFAQEVVGVRAGYNSGKMNAGAAAAALPAIAEKYGRIVYGREDGWQATSWNTPLELGRYIVEHWHVEPSSVVAARHMFLLAAIELTKGMADHEDGKTSDSDAKAKVDGLIEHLVDTILGRIVEDD